MTASLLRRYGVARTPAQQNYYAAADRVAATLGEDALQRDRDNLPPFAELETLRGTGLLPLTVPQQYGGAGIDWRTAYEIVQRIGRTDNSIAQLLGYHYIFQAFPYVDLSPARAQQLSDATHRDQLLFSSTGTPQGAQVQARPVDGGFIVYGKKPFATGSRVADRIYGRAILPDGNRLAFLLDTSWEGVERHDDWDMLGSRLSATNSIEFHDVFVPDDCVITNLGKSDADRAPHQVLTTPSFQLLFSHVYLAAAEGAVLEAAEYTRTKSRAWFHADVDTPPEDPFIQNQYGSFVSRLQTLAAVIDQATTALQWGWDQGTDLTDAQRAGIAEQVAAAKIQAHHTSLDVTTQIFDVIGARAAGTKYGFDRYWREVRTHTLHDPVAYKLNELGRYFLSSEAPVPSAYR